jgi:hypothetical protein
MRLDRLAENGDSGTVGIYFDEAGTVCSGEILPGVPKTVYVIAKLNGVTACGVVGGEFRFSGVPDNWSVFPVARDEMLAIGNPFIGGVTFAFPECQQPQSENVLLYTVLVLASEYVPDVTFRILQRLEPTNPKHACSFLHTCDETHGTICMDGISCHVNPAVPKSCEVAVGIEATTWSAVKQLFQVP